VRTVGNHHFAISLTTITVCDQAPVPARAAAYVLARSIPKPFGKAHLAEQLYCMCFCIDMSAYYSFELDFRPAKLRLLRIAWNQGREDGIDAGGLLLAMELSCRGHSLPEGLRILDKLASKGEPRAFSEKANIHYRSWKLTKNPKEKKRLAVAAEQALVEGMLRHDPRSANSLGSHLWRGNMLQRDLES
jgi:hypothetical protein